MFTVTIEKSFCASHQLRDYDGPCARLHGHNWKVRIEVKAEALDSVGMAMDFVDLESATWSVLGELDHRHLNDIPPFDQINPTAENVAQYIYEKVIQQLPEKIILQRVDLWENEIYRVSYAPQN